MEGKTKSWRKGNASYPPPGYGPVYSYNKIYKIVNKNRCGKSDMWNICNKMTICQNSLQNSQQKLSAYSANMVIQVDSIVLLIDSTRAGKRNSF